MFLVVHFVNLNFLCILNAKGVFFSPEQAVLDLAVEIEAEQFLSGVQIPNNDAAFFTGNQFVLKNVHGDDRTHVSLKVGDDGMSLKVYHYYDTVLKRN